MEVDLTELVRRSLTFGEGGADEFSGVVRVDCSSEDAASGRRRSELALGYADRANGRTNTLSTRFGTASATKGLTALTVMSLVQEGLIELDQPVAEWTSRLLPLVDERVTIAQLMQHRSGIGDYLDEEQLGDIDDHVFDVPSHTLQRPLDYVDLLAPHGQVSEPGAVFAYNNSGFVLLSIIIEQVAGSFHDAVAERVLEPAGMARCGFFRSDDLPSDVAVGYLADGRTNLFHIPVIGAGDGGIYLTLDDVQSFWTALFAGRIVSRENVSIMSKVMSTGSSNGAYGTGFWVHPVRDGGRVADALWLEGMDAGVSFLSKHKLDGSWSYTVMSNTSAGVWPIVHELDDLLGRTT